MDNHTPTESSPVAFFVLTFLLSVPFYILNALAYLTTLCFPLHPHADRVGLDPDVSKERMGWRENAPREDL